MVKREIRNKIREFVKELGKNKIKVNRVILYGSEVLEGKHTIIVI